MRRQQQQTHPRRRGCAQTRTRSGTQQSRTATRTACGTATSPAPPTAPPTTESLQPHHLRGERTRGAAVEYKCALLHRRLSWRRRPPPPPPPAAQPPPSSATQPSNHSFSTGFRLRPRNQLRPPLPLPQQHQGRIAKHKRARRARVSRSAARPAPKRPQGWAWARHLPACCCSRS